MKRVLGSPVSGLLPVIGFFALAVTVAPVACAQFTGSYQTNIISGVVSNWYLDYYVGSNTVFDQLQVINAGFLSSWRGHVGEYGTANSVLIDGSGSVWSNQAEFYVGLGGKSNWVLVSNGGMLLCGRGSISGTNNDALITGDGSVWKCGVYSPSLVAGDYFGSGNSLTISNAGLLDSSEAWIGDTASSNTVRVTGVGSRWVASLLKVGFSSSPSTSANSTYNSLLIEDGGTVVSSNAIVGSAILGAATSNAVVVSGTGSVWSNQSAITIGFGGPGPMRENSLVISNRGAVVSGSVSVGNSNRLTLADGNLIVPGGLTVLRPAGLLEGAGTISGNTTVFGILSPGNPTGTLTEMGDLVVQTNLSSRPVLNFDLGSNSDLVIVTGNLTLNATLNIKDAGGLGVGIYTLFTYGGSLLTNALTVATAPTNFIYAIDTTMTGQVRLVITSAQFQQWQLDYFGSSNTPPAEAVVDADGDGQSNLHEYLAGTDPTNASSVFRVLSVELTNNDILVTWATAAGRTNALQAAGAGGHYTNSFSDIFTVTNTTGSTTNYLDVGAATNVPARYYRVRLVP